ncbi:hypothetical protein N7478_008461 [Penicillium angulare]|uniref:uncharacterized protein n=1 Tax=Penicillium angulare TaxID=116970 RepID=UPI0025412FBC|nr:uncharacterized protein N7478_008461 [Penicillium angulare]KAJ5273336.1 hypothetical protein N7478_008461 [Penicillium angulare]
MLARSSPATYVSRPRALLKNLNTPTYNYRILHNLAFYITRPRPRPRTQPTTPHPRLTPRSHTIPRHLPFSTSTTMASDDAYMDFLNKANADKDAGAGQAPAQGTQTKTVDTSFKLPASLKDVDIYYVSDADEPFEPVLLRWEGAAKGEWPSADAFSSLISPNKDISQGISTLSHSSFDPKNQYSEAVEAVRAAASNSDIKVYRVEITSTKLEYFLVALDESEGGRVIGLKAKAVES